MPGVGSDMQISPEKNRRLRGSVQSFVVKPDDPGTPFVSVVEDIYVRVIEDIMYSDDTTYVRGEILFYEPDSVSDTDPWTSFGTVERNVRSRDDLDALLNVYVLVTEDFPVGEDAYTEDNVLRYNFGSPGWVVMDQLMAGSAVELDNQVPKYTNDEIFARVTGVFEDYVVGDLLLYKSDGRGWIEANLREVASSVDLDGVVPVYDAPSAGLLTACVRQGFAGYSDGDVILYKPADEVWNKIDLSEVNSQEVLNGLVEQIPDIFTTDAVEVMSGGVELPVSDFVLEGDGSEARFNVELPMVNGTVVVSC